MEQIVSLNTQLSDIRDTLTKAKADADACCNYLEKYSNVYMQR